MTSPSSLQTSSFPENTRQETNRRVFETSVDSLIDAAIGGDSCAWDQLREVYGRISVKARGILNRSLERSFKDSPLRMKILRVIGGGIEG